MVLSYTLSSFILIHNSRINSITSYSSWPEMEVLFCFCFFGKLLRWFLMCSLEREAAYYSSWTLEKPPIPSSARHHQVLGTRAGGKVTGVGIPREEDPVWLSWQSLFKRCISEREWDSGYCPQNEEAWILVLAQPTATGCPSFTLPFLTCRIRELDSEYLYFPLSSRVWEPQNIRLSKYFYNQMTHGKA